MFFILIISCSKTKTIKVNNIDYTYWTSIEISPENQRINIYYDSDSAKILSWDIKDSIVPDFGTFHIRTNYRTEKFFLNKQDRDTLFKYTFDMIQDTTRPKDFCTEFCGHVTFSIHSRQVVLSSSYSSICHWNTISYKTNKMYTILSKKTKIQTSSDCVQ